jgi:hypothetical protein
VEVKRVEEAAPLPSWFVPEGRNIYWYDADPQKVNPYLPKKKRG